MLVEISGLPRCGKTRTIEKILKQTNHFKHVREAFDKVPFLDPTSFKYNEWYANYCIEISNKLYKSNDSYFLERGILDRIAFSQALFNSGYISGEENNKLQDLLKPHSNKRDLTILFNTSVDESMKFIKRPKNHFSQKKEFVTFLNKAYFELKSDYENILLVPTFNNDLDKRTDYIIQELIEKI
jgi:hypothetical protein